MMSFGGWRTAIVAVVAIVAALRNESSSGQQAVSDDAPALDLVELIDDIPSPAEAGGSEDTAIPGGANDGLSLPEDAVVQRRFSQSVRLAENGRTEEAALALGRLLEFLDDRDLFLRTDGPEQSRSSLKSELRRLVDELPSTGREAYELGFGIAARRMLDGAPHDVNVIRRITSRYLQTEAGAEALYRLAAQAHDRGNNAEAIACIRRLRTLHPDAVMSFEPGLSLLHAACCFGTDDHAAADALLTELDRKRPGITITIGGRHRPAAEAAAVLSQAMSRGKESEVPTSGIGEPFPIPRWSRELIAGRRDRTKPDTALPLVVPTVIGSQIFVPSENGFTTFELETGRRLWSYPSTGAVAFPANSTDMSEAQGSLSTDGRAIYIVESDRARHPPAAASVSTEGIPFVAAPQQQAAFFQMQRVAITPASIDTPRSPTDPLLALEVTPPKQGNRRWGVGGQDGGDEPALAGHVFLGPPYVHAGRLYAITEFDRNVRLVVLEAASGRLAWSLDLAHGERSVASDPRRQRAGVTPTLADGALICPTGGSLIVAVDLIDRSFRWGFRLAPMGAPVQESADGPETQPVSESWADLKVLIAGGSVLLSSRGSGDLFCLDQETGVPLWHQRRGEALFVAATDSKRVLLVGRSTATLLNLADGTPAARPTSFPRGSASSGRGYTGEGVYFQPLTDGSVLRVDLQSGSQEIVMPPTQEALLGNLLWHNGVMLSVDSAFLRAFDDRVFLESTIRARLARNAGDHQSLLRRADLSAHAGRFAEAIQESRTAYALKPSAQSKNRLVAALLDGIRYGMPEAGTYDAELDRLAWPE